MRPGLLEAGVAMWNRWLVTEGSGAREVEVPVRGLKQSGTRAGAACLERQRRARGQAIVSLTPTDDLAGASPCCHQGCSSVSADNIVHQVMPGQSFGR
jgi:hypothetical protein